MVGPHLNRIIVVTAGLAAGDTTLYQNMDEVSDHPDRKQVVNIAKRPLKVLLSDRFRCVCFYLLSDVLCRIM